MGRGGASDDGPGDRQRRRPAPALLPARMAVSRGIWLAAATAALTIATVLSVTLAGGGGGAGARALTDAWGGAENALASAWGGGEKRANGTKVLLDSHYNRCPQDSRCAERQATGAAQQRAPLATRRLRASCACLPFLASLLISFLAALLQWKRSNRACRLSFAAGLLF